MKQEIRFSIHPVASHASSHVGGVVAGPVSRWLQGDTVFIFVLFMVLCFYASSLFALPVPERSYSTFLGQGGSDSGAGIATDSDGNMYVAGSVRASPNPAQSDESDNTDIFVAKLNADGSELVYLTYIGGAEADFANDICVDSSGNAYVTGGTRSTDFPVLAATQESSGGKLDAFLVRLNSNGTTTYSSYLGGENNEDGKGIACNDAGHVYITGLTNSPDFPIRTAYQSELNPAGGDVFITRINVPGSAIVYSTYLGGTFLDAGNGIATDGVGNIYITGSTGSQDFPLVNPLQSAKGGKSLSSSPDAFIAKLSADGSELLYSTYLGGDLADKGNRVVVDEEGNAHVTGSTFSTDFPTVNAIQSTHRGKLDVFVAKINPAGTALVYSTFLGGRQSDLGNDIAIDAAGNAYITGSTDSEDFPMTSAFQAGYAGGARDAFVAKMSPEGSLLFSSFFGGGLFDEAASISADSAGSAYITGRTTSATLPTENAIQPNYGGGSFDPFVVKIVAPPCPDRGRPGRGKCK